MMTADNGVVTAWQSYLGNLAMSQGRRRRKSYWTDSEMYRCSGGNQQLAQKLAAAIGAAKVLTRMPARTIAVTDRGARVTLADGKVLEADHVMLTAPPSTWNRIAIDPSAAADARAADGDEREVPDRAQGRFWRRAELAPDSLSDGPVSLTWDGTDGQPAARRRWSRSRAAPRPISAASGGRRRAARTTSPRSRRSTAASGRTS